MVHFGRPEGPTRAAACTIVTEAVKKNAVPFMRSLSLRELALNLINDDDDSVRQAAVRFCGSLVQGRPLTAEVSRLP